MKTLCVAVVALSLISVCQAASLACENLMKPVDKDPDISGTWHYIAVSLKHCLNSTIINGSFWPSASADITAQNTSNIYDGNVKVKVSGKCVSNSGSFHYANHSFIDRNNASTSNTHVLLQTGCPDCLVVMADIINTLALFSRRKSVDPAELKEFETQAECLGKPKPLVFSTDHDYENCPPFDHDDFEEARTTIKALLCMEG